MAGYYLFTNYKERMLEHPKRLINIVMGIIEKIQKGAELAESYVDDDHFSTKVIFLFMLISK